MRLIVSSEVSLQVLQSHIGAAVRLSVSRVGSATGASVSCGAHSEDHCVQ